MKIENININSAIENARKQIAEDKTLSPSMRTTFDLLILIISLLVHKQGINSSNSSLPPSKDPNRKKKRPLKLKVQKKKPGAQVGHKGTTLLKSDAPNEIENIKVDRRTIPSGNYKVIGFDSRQVFDINISLHIKEYRAEILENENGKKFSANFPNDVKKAVQYGSGIRSQAVYMSIFQMIPLDRILDYFKEQAGLSVSKGSISNFKTDAYLKLFEIGYKNWVENKLLHSKVLHADETGINVGGKRIWLHGVSNENYVLYHPDLMRGKDAMDRMGILENFKGVLCHDHWKPYYKFEHCTHSLCNAHHLRELTRAHEQDEQSWANQMKNLLNEIYKNVQERESNCLDIENIKKYQKRYRTILSKGKKECPLIINKTGIGRKIRRCKARNLLERLERYEEDVLRFMKEGLVPFTNNQGENDIRMTKVQQKISGCFRSMDGANEFSLLRSYIVTAKKQGMGASEALRLLFRGETPEFMKN